MMQKGRNTPCPSPRQKKRHMNPKLLKAKRFKNSPCSERRWWFVVRFFDTFVFMTQTCELFTGRLLPEAIGSWLQVGFTPIAGRCLLTTWYAAAGDHKVTGRIVAANTCTPNVSSRYAKRLMPIVVRKVVGRAKSRDRLRLQRCGKVLIDI